MKQYFISYLLFFLFLSIPVACFAQVTIGSTQPPQKAAILDLRTKDAIDEDNVSANKGLLLSRVHLNDINSLEPFIISATENEKKQHIGLKVYNVNDTSPLSEGVYVWNGASWELYESSTDSTPILDGSNGISKSSSALRLGGELTKATTIDQSGYNLRFNNTAGTFSINTNALAISGTNVGIGASPSSTSKLTIGGNMLTKNDLTANGSSSSSLKKTVVTGNLNIKNPATDLTTRYILKNTDASGTSNWVPFSELPGYNLSEHREASVTEGLTMTLSQWNTTGASGEQNVPGFELKLTPGRWLICLSITVEPQSVTSNTQNPIWGRFRFNYYNGSTYSDPSNYSSSPGAPVSYIGALNIADRIYPNVTENIIKGYLILNITGAERTLRLRIGGRSTASGYEVWSNVSNVRIGNPSNPQNYAVAIPM